MSNGMVSYTISEKNREAMKAIPQGKKSKLVDELLTEYFQKRYVEIQKALQPTGINSSGGENGSV
jgi:hypothetical protein